MSLRASLQTDMLQCVANFKEEVQELGGRVDKIEHKMGEFAASHNSLIDSHNEHDDQLENLKAKLADLEDRSRRNNLKLRGVPETVLNTHLNQYACDLIKAVLPSIPASEVVIDRIHRLPKPSYLSDDIPRDVIMRVHFYHVKDQLMTSFRKNNQIPERFSRLQVYADLSQYTLQKRKSLLPITKALRNHEIVYRWGFPTKLTVTYNNTTTVITSLDEGLALLRSWDILPTQEPASGSSPSKIGSQDDWQTVSRKRKQKKRDA